MLTNEGIVLLARAGFSDQFIMDMIRLKDTRFDVSAEGLAALAENGLTERLIRCMVAHERKFAPDEARAGAPAAVPIMVRETRMRVLAPATSSSGHPKILLLRTTE
jgi:hypothetical protein